MARIVLGIGTSHSPQLSLRPDQWWLRTEADKRNPALWYRGKTYVFPDLVRERAGAHFEDQLSPEKAQERFDTCQRSIAALAETLESVAPDAVVIVGDDQDEIFFR